MRFVLTKQWSRRGETLARFLDLIVPRGSNMALAQAMSKTCRALLVAELLIAFAPLCLGWIILIVLSLNYLPAIGTSDFHWVSLILMVGLCIAGAIGAVALNAMRVYLFWGGKKLIPRRRMIVYCAVAVGVLAALAALSLPGMFGDISDYFGVVYIIPLLSALHVLWLGRSYFTGANKLLQATCDDART